MLSPPAYPMQPFVDLLKLDATLVNVGALEDLQSVSGRSLIFGRKSIAGSVVGGIADSTSHRLLRCPEHQGGYRTDPPGSNQPGL
jgi:D-arabinose 1-dehydrogenase-like Zn-dependent alcohol dehydrogenase